jgi:parvulin-like peptidyl-prolyl isomerase
MRQAADTLGITVGDKEIKEKLKDSGQAVTDALVDVTRSQELETRLTDEYFGVQVPVSEDQVQFMALLSESESLASEARDKLMSGESFATLLEQYNQHSYAKAVEGDFGLHPRGILQGETDSAVPLDFAFGAEVGTVSPPLADNETFKSIGYWLLKVVGRPSDNSAMVQAVYLSSREEALDIKARLEAGEDLGALAEQYSQYTASKEKRGELGLIDKPSDDTTTAVSEPFDGYVFDPATELGKWSDPIADTKFSTQGGYWLVQLIDKQINADLSDEDRQTLIYKAYSDWIGGLYLQYAAEIDYSGLTSENRAWAIVRAGEELQQLGG